MGTFDGMDVPRGTIVVWSDIGCAWAHLAVHRLHETRHRLALDDEVTFEHLAFPLELFNDRPTQKRAVEAEMVALGGHEPDAGFHIWRGRDSEWPVTTLPALEAVRAAHLQGVTAAETLDRALRRAMFTESRCISLRHVILEVADECDDLDPRRLAEDLDAGVARRRVIDEWRRATAADVKGSPHLFFPDGTDTHNPGLRTHWDDGGFPVIEADDPSVYEGLLKRAANDS